MRLIRLLGITLVALVCLYIVAIAGLYVAMHQPPERFGAIMSKVPRVAMMVLPFRPLWMSARAGQLAVGDTAPDFTLPTPDRSRTVKLSEEWRERPVALIFGSYTWPPFRREVPELNRLYQTYQHHVTFYVVYIQEAHPTDLWQLPVNVRDGVLFASPRSDDERTSTALACVRKLGIRIPAVLDHIDNRTERAWTAWPDRMFLIDTSGRIVYKSAPGPFGFSTQALERSLQEITKTLRSHSQSPAG